MKRKKRIIIFIIILMIIFLPEIKRSIRSSDIVYKNEDIGMSMTLPKEWDGRYKIEEKKDAIYVYYTPRFSLSRGLLFAIVKLTPEGNPCDGDIYDSMGPREIAFRGVKYTCGGTTDVGFPDNSIHYKTYVSMRSDASKVLKTLRTLD